MCVCVCEKDGTIWRRSRQSVQKKKQKNNTLPSSTSTAVLPADLSSSSVSAVQPAECVCVCKRERVDASVSAAPSRCWWKPQPGSKTIKSAERTRTTHTETHASLPCCLSYSLWIIRKVGSGSTFKEIKANIVPFLSLPLNPPKTIKATLRGRDDEINLHICDSLG